MSAKRVTLALLALSSAALAKRRLHERMREAVESLNAEVYEVSQGQGDVATRQVESTMTGLNLDDGRPSLLELTENSGTQLVPGLPQLHRRAGPSRYSGASTGMKTAVGEAPKVEGIARREVLSGVAAAALAAFTSQAALAVDVNDLSRLKKGRESVQFLLDNWDTETVNPQSGADDPDRVRFFVGLRTTDHPLFQVEKLLNNAQKQLPEDADIETWIDAVEGLNSHIAKINELAYTSSFGEYNPGGGKGQVRKYLLLAKEEVVLLRDSLDTMIKILKL